MAIKYTDKPFKSSFAEDDVYFYERELDELAAMAEEALHKSDFSDPVLHLDPSDEGGSELNIEV